jgi:hypothetical protein
MAKFVRAMVVAGFAAALAFPSAVVEEHHEDFWATNVAELYTLVSAGDASAPSDDPAIKLIELSVAAADFRGCDGGSNRVEDFWTTDVSGLYTVTSIDVLMPGTKGALRVIEFTADAPGGTPKP